MKRTNPKKGKDEDPGWERITWDEAYSLIADKVKDALASYPYKKTGANGDDYYYDGKDNPIAWLGSSYWNNEECYLGRKLISLLGSNNVEHQARKCHASTVAALANTFGFGAMTNHIVDAKNSKCFLIVSNPAESHTMEFKWVTQAKENGATIIVLDPRFNRTGAKADIYSRYRSGAEAAIFMGLIRYALYAADEDREDYVDYAFLESRTNAPFTIEGEEVGITDPNSIFRKLKALVENYDSDEVQRISGIPATEFKEIAETFTSTKPGNIFYAMGTTQHTNATQAIRAQAILQLTLGNMGRPGGGVNALRGISNVQGSTDMNLLSHLIMGYRAPPKTVEEIREYQKWKNTDATTRGGTPANKITAQYHSRHFPTWNSLEYHWGVYVGTWPGADPDNEPVVSDLPVRTGNAIIQLFRAIQDGTIKVLICNGENPAVSVANANLVRKAMESDHLFLVVDELYETETAVYADILLPGTTQVERDGSLTNTGRWIQWRWKSVDPPGECRQELTYLTELYQNIRATLKTNGIKLPSEKYEDEHPGQDIKKTIGTEDVQNDPEAAWPSRFGTSAEGVYKESGAKSIQVGGVTLPQSAANVIYKNMWDPELRPDLDGILAKRRDPNPVDLEDATYGYYKNWAYSWMLNQRILYQKNESKAGVSNFFSWFAISDKKWLGWDVAAIFSRPLYKPDGKEVTSPFAHGMPLHNEPLESPDTELATEYPTMWDTENPKFPVVVGDPSEYPYVLTTFRLAEHMQAGAMTRNLSWLVETHPSMFVEMSPELAQILDISKGDEVLVKSARNLEGITVKAMVTDRIKPITVNGETVHEVAMPWHWGFKGLSTGPSANELTMDAVDASANIPETKACLVSIEKI
jgi:formate dehydrogenase major subunit